MPVPRKRPAKVAGFTLIELMVVVVIIAILAVVAIPAFQRYLYRARASEGLGFLQEIHSREMAYQVDNGQFAAPASDNPATMPSGVENGAWNTTDAEWLQLGAAPDSAAVHFQYHVDAGIPGTTPAGGLGYDGSDFWFVAKATGDLDGDGTTFFFEIYSFATHYYCSSDAGYD